MHIQEIENRTPQLASELLDVWERSVRVTHLFLSSAQIDAIKKHVPQALQDVKHLVVAFQGTPSVPADTATPKEAPASTPIAFMGIEGDRLEMLFIAPEERGRGLGRRLLQLGMEGYGVRELTVNEQNPQATGFYEHMGFAAYKRTEPDEEGNPYPLLHMRLWGTPTADCLKPSQLQRPQNSLYHP